MNVLITGSPGVGKTTIGKLLEEKGYKYIDFDDNKELKYWEEKETGKRVISEGRKSLDWCEKHDVNLDIDNLKNLLSGIDEEVIFVGGVMSNITKVIDFFDKVFLLEIDLETLRKRRLDRRDEKSKEGLAGYVI